MESTDRHKKHPFLTPFPLLCAHRGDSANYPENTLPAFRSAAEMGVDCIETDLHLTRDGQCVVWHDPSVDRMSDGRGMIRDYDLAELQRLDAGYRFSRDGGESFPFRGQGIRIPTLEELLSELPQMRLNIDLKESDPALVEHFAGILERHRAAGRVLGASFHHRTLTLLRRRLPQLPTSFSRREAAGFLFRQKLRFLPPPSRSPGRVLQVPVRYGSLTVVTPAFIRRAHRAGLFVQVWTVNEEREMERLLAMEVDGLFTDKPALLQEVLRRRGMI
jgi:glycerophosphoryl diester phosphodiesterase